MTAHQQRIRTPYSQKVQEFKRRGLPIAVWSLATLVCVVLMVRRTAQFEYVGIARALEYEVSATATGTVESLEVKLFDSIDAGQVVVVEERQECHIGVRDLAAVDGDPDERRRDGLRHGLQGAHVSALIVGVPVRAGIVEFMQGGAAAAPIRAAARGSRRARIRTALAGTRRRTAAATSIWTVIVELRSPRTPWRR